MADIRYNVSQLFKAAFGIQQPIYITEPFTSKAPANISFSGLEVMPDFTPQNTPKSWMGTPILFGAKFMGGNYMRFKENGEIERIRLDDFDLPPATMFSFRRAKNIEKTLISGGDGTVKEFYSLDDWVIDVRGLCLDEPTRSAQEQITQLLQWEELVDGIGISGQLFEQHKISRVALDSWNDSLQQGKPDVVPFQFQLFSDKDIILIL